jgi:hypothetical protein
MASIWSGSTVSAALAGQAENHRAVRAVADAGKGQRAVQAGAIVAVRAGGSGQSAT